MATNGWPTDWDERIAGRDCPLCTTGPPSDTDHALHVTELEFVDVRLERRSRLPGYCVVVWRHGHVVEPTDLDPDLAAGYWRDVLAVARAVQSRFEPVKLNFLTLGNLVPHLHTHVVPRHEVDPAPGGFLPWDDLFADEPTPAAELDRQAEDLRLLLTGAGA
jgi:diadenosine tetraphosphate (Ap4A) HIT family hydrolase